MDACEEGDKLQSGWLLLMTGVVVLVLLVVAMGVGYCVSCRGHGGCF